MSDPETTREDDPETEHQVWLASLPEWCRDEIEHEIRTSDRVHAATVELVAALSECPSLWKSGDGYGGSIMGDLYAQLEAAGFERKAPKNRSPSSRAPSIPWGRRYEVMERDGFKCLACGIQKRLTMDHVVPISQGGGDESENLQTLCLPCNVSKGIRTVDYR